MLLRSRGWRSAGRWKAASVRSLGKWARSLLGCRREGWYRHVEIITVEKKWTSDTEVMICPQAMLGDFHNLNYLRFLPSHYLVLPPLTTSAKLFPIFLTPISYSSPLVPP